MAFCSAVLTTGFIIIRVVIVIDCVGLFLTFSNKFLVKNEFKSHGALRKCLTFC